MLYNRLSEDLAPENCPSLISHPSIPEQVADLQPQTTDEASLPQASGGPPPYNNNTSSDAVRYYPNWPQQFSPSSYQQQQQQQTSVVVVPSGTQPAVWTQPAVVYQSFGAHIVLACVVIWLCGVLFGFVAFILAGKGNVYYLIDLQVSLQVVVATCKLWLHTKSLQPTDTIVQSWHLSMSMIFYR